MKHNLKITAILLTMFILAQFIGLYVVDFYSGEETDLPYGLETPEPETEKDFYFFFYQIVIAFMIAIALLFILTRFNIPFLICDL